MDSQINIFRASSLNSSQDALVGRVNNVKCLIFDAINELAVDEMLANKP